VNLRALYSCKASGAVTFSTLSLLSSNGLDSYVPSYYFMSCLSAVLSARRNKREVLVDLSHQVEVI
jgi:hypothetical protein